MADGTLKVGTITTSSGSGTITVPSTVTIAGAIASTPAFSARLNANQTLVTATWTKGNFNTEIFDSDGKYDTSNYRFTPGLAGYYRVSAHGYLQCTDTNFGKVSIYKNGSSYAFTANGYPFSNYQTQQIEVVMYLDADDYVEAFFNQEAGSDKILLGENGTESNFAAERIIGA
jgi:hypothetical protein